MATGNLTRRQSLSLMGAGLLSACTPSLHRTKDADIIIIGAGLSGLAAARILESEGAKVIVIEATERIGGRMKTLSNLPGHPEAGGSQIGQTYARIRKTAQDLNVSLRASPPPLARGRTYALGGELIHSSDWSNSALNPFPEPFRAAGPDRALFATAGAANPFEDVYGWREVDPSLDVSAEAYLTQVGFDERARALCDIALNANALSTYSMVNVWRTLTLFSQDGALGPSHYITDGSERLPKAMAASLSGDILLGEPVQTIALGDSFAEVKTSSRTLSADFVIAAIPFPAFTRIDITPDLTAEQTKAVHNLPYTQIQQIHIGIENEFWTKDGLPVSMWTDTPIERVFPHQDPVTGEIIGLICWINGQGTRPSTSDADWFDLATTTLKTLRGANVRPLEMVRWDTKQAYSGGAYMHWAPGQTRQWAETMGAPHGRLHFAGEHLSYLHTGMEGAMESGERAAFDILTYINPT